MGRVSICIFSCDGVCLKIFSTHLLKFLRILVGMVAHQVQLLFHSSRVTVLILISGLRGVFYVLSVSALVSFGFSTFFLPAKNMLVRELLIVCVHGALWWPGSPFNMYPSLMLSAPETGSVSTITLAGIKRLLKMMNECINFSGDHVYTTLH